MEFSVSTKDFVFPKRCSHWGRDAATYQEGIYLLALQYVKKRDLAIDCGAHVGIFTRRMERDFKEVYSFEPAEDNFRCLAQNTTKARLFNCCLWNESAGLSMKFTDHPNSGANEVDGLGNYPALPLDVFDLSPDLIKMDVQGSEANLLIGAIRTLRSRPVLILEVVKDSGLEDVMRNLGYEQKDVVSRDQVWI